MQMLMIWNYLSLVMWPLWHGQTLQVIESWGWLLTLWLQSLPLMALHVCLATWNWAEGLLNISLVSGNSIFLTARTLPILQWTGKLTLRNLNAISTAQNLSHERMHAPDLIQLLWTPNHYSAPLSNLFTPSSVLFWPQCQSCKCLHSSPWSNSIYYRICGMFFSFDFWPWMPDVEVCSCVGGYLEACCQDNYSNC